MSAVLRRDDPVCGGSAKSEIILHGRDPRRADRETIGAMLADCAGREPDRVFLQQRSPTGWRTLTYSEALAAALKLGRALLDFGLSEERPLAILSGNSIDHALIALGAQLAGIPVAPISTAYSLLGELDRLQGIFDILTPGLVYAEDGDEFDRALEVAANRSLSLLVSHGASGRFASDRLDQWLSRNVDAGSMALPTVTRQTIAKILFTSGSTGAPKGVIVTHGMMCANQEGLSELWPFLEQEPLVFVDWLPWNHCFGGNLVFNCALRHAGTLIIDDGRPVPGQFERSIRTLKEFPPVVHFGVPRGFSELVNALERDEAFAEAYFSRLRATFTAGASLPDVIWTRYRALAKRYARPDFDLFVSWGATETAPIVSLSPIGNERPDNIGFPLPGVTIKLVPNDDKYELRVRGPMVMPGYWRRPDLQSEAFDGQGFYKIGDAGKLLDPEKPEKGILFDGRVAENFKLVTGTWVQVGQLRLNAIAAGTQIIQDAVVTGHDRDEVGLLVFPHLDGCRAIAGLPSASMEELVCNATVRAAVARSLLALGRTGGSSSRVARALLLAEPASMATGEITDKGYLNQRAVLRQRAADVERLYVEPPHPDVIFPAA